MINQDNVMQLRERYRISIINHRSNVSKVWNNMKTDVVCRNALDECLKIFNGKSNSILLTNLINIVNSQVGSHDMSKMSDEEFEPYRKEFFPVDETEKEKNAQDFEVAWQHHYNNNMHHWNWWAYNHQKDKMLLTFVVEMCMDWIAMSITYPSSNAYEWFKNKEEIVLGEKQRLCVETILKTYYTQFNVHGEPIT